MNIIAFALYIIGISAIISVILMIFSFAFSSSFIQVDFSNIIAPITLAIGLLIVVLGVYVFFIYIPSIIERVK